MKVYFAADHAGFPLKEILKPYVASLGYEVEDVGAHVLDVSDDYVPFMKAIAEKVSARPEDTRAITIGASGQGEALVPNRYKRVRAIVYYGPAAHPQTDAEGKVLDIISSSREHNNANVLSLGARFLTEEEAKTAVKRWLETPFGNGERHARRIRMIDE
jgi:ribose 5-phosphate isomerase B